MKSLNFRQRNNYIRGKKEESRKKRFNYERLTYIVILLVLIIILVWTYYDNILYVKGKGQVLFKKLDVQFTHDVRITKFFYEEGDTIMEGDSLFSYLAEEDIGSYGGYGGDLSYSRNRDNDWVKREILDLTLKRDVKAIERDKYKTLLSVYNGQLERAKKEVYLDLHSAESLSPHLKRINDSKAMITALNAEIGTLNSYLARLKEQEAKVDSLNIALGSGPGIDQDGTYRSPVDGLISRIYKEDHEVALESEHVMSIHQREDIFIKAYFRQKDLNHLSEGQKVTVKFPNGEKSKGFIERFYISTLQIPDEFQKTYEPKERSIVVDIRPATAQDLQTWIQYYKMEADIMIFKRRGFF